MTRHQKTIHDGTSRFWCTEPGCHRSEHYHGHKRPFPRKDKRDEHVRRIHKTTEIASAELGFTNIGPPPANDHNLGLTAVNGEGFGLSHAELGVPNTSEHWPSFINIEPGLDGVDEHWPVPTNTEPAPVHVGEQGSQFAIIDGQEFELPHLGHGIANTGEHWFDPTNAGPELVNVEEQEYTFTPTDGQELEPPYNELEVPSTDKDWLDLIDAEF